MFEERLKEWAAERGYALAIAGAGVIEAVREKLEERKSAGMIEAGFFNDYLASFRYLDASAIAGPKCVVMVAVPSPIQVLPFTVEGKKIDALIPPTYVRYNATFADVLGDMKENALGQDAAAETLKAPLKSLAVHMGLVVYGRNNITYAPGLGSGYQLCGYVVGMGEEPFEMDGKADWRETFLERCTNCQACVKACPTNAIREDRFLISAERCFTIFSESRKPIPSWVRPLKPTCLIGCMVCQRVCPENKGRLKTVFSGVEFTAEETEAIIETGRRLGSGAPGADDGKGAGKSRAFESARAKFEPLGMSDDLEVMGRNIDFFLQQEKNEGPDTR